MKQVMFRDISTRRNQKISYKISNLITKKIASNSYPLSLHNQRQRRIRFAQEPVLVQMDLHRYVHNQEPSLFLHSIFNKDLFIKIRIRFFFYFLQFLKAIKTRLEYDSSRKD